MMRTASASDLLDAVSSPEIEEGSSQSLPPSTTEKRKHAEIRDGSTKSPPLPATEKRDCVEILELPVNDWLPWGRGEGCKCKEEAERERCKCYDKEEEARRERMVFNGLPKDVQERYLKAKERASAGRIRPPVYESHYCNADDEQIGDLGGTPFVYSKQNGKIDVADGYTRVCSNPFTPLDFEEDSDLYLQLKGFGKRVVAHFNSSFKRTVCFEDIASVTSCHSSCNHSLVTIKVTDPGDKYSEIIVRGRVYDSFAVAKVNHFAILVAH